MKLKPIHLVVAAGVVYIGWRIAKPTPKLASPAVSHPEPVPWDDPSQNDAIAEADAAPPRTITEMVRSWW